MTREEITSEILRIFKSEFEIEDPGLDDDLRETYEFDSVDAIELLIGIERFLKSELTHEEKKMAMDIRTEPAVAGTSSLGKDETIPSGHQIVFHALDLVDPVNGQRAFSRGGDVAGCPENPAENRKPEIIAFHDGLLPFEQRHQKDRVEKGEVVGKDHAGTERLDLRRYAPCHVGNQRPQQGEKRPVETVVQPLKGLFPMG